MIGDQAADRPDRFIVKAEPLHDLFRHLRPDGRMTDEVVPPLVVRLAAGRLSDVVKEGGQAEDPLCRDIFNDPDRVLPDRVEVVDRILRCLHADVKLRQEDLRKAQGIEVPHHLRVVGDEELDHFLPDPLGTDF